MKNKKADGKKTKKNTIACRISKICIAVIISISILLVFFLYGPFPWLRVFLITTSMHTSEHQYIAKMLYTSKTITDVMENNRVIELDDKTNVSEISSAPDNTIELIRIEESMYSGILLKVADPARISAAVSDNEAGMLLEEIALKEKAVAAINAAGYKDIRHQGISEGLVISDNHKFFDNSETQYSIIGFDKNNKLILGKFSNNAMDSLDLRDAVDFGGPFLIINGEKATILGNGGGISPRTAIGQTNDGTVLLLVLDGRQLGSIGATLKDIQDIMFQYGAINAANLDGGSSVSMFYNGEIVNSLFQSDNHRRIPCCFIVK